MAKVITTEFMGIPEYVYSECPHAGQIMFDAHGHIDCFCKKAGFHCGTLNHISGSSAIKCPF